MRKRSLAQREPTHPTVGLHRLMVFSHQSPEQDNDKTNVEHVHFYYAFHTRSDMSGVKDIIGMHRFNICLVVVLSLSCSGVKTPLKVQYIGFTAGTPLWLHDPFVT